MGDLVARRAACPSGDGIPSPELHRTRRVGSRAPPGSEDHEARPVTLDPIGRGEVGAMEPCFGLEVDGQTWIVDFGAATVPNPPCTWTSPCLMNSWPCTA